MSEYVLDLWYMAAWEEEIEGDALLPRTLLDQPWLLMRKQDGTGYAMLSDRCPHRFAAVHKGERDGDTIQCPYHGLVFETGGACIRNPFSDLIPPNARLRALPVVARHGALWFWPGDPEGADPALIPDFSVLDAAEPFVRGRTRFEADYELITDNLMDLSHAEYLHRDTFRTEGKIFGGDYKVREADDGAIWSEWNMRGTERPAWLDAVPEGTRLDEWLEMRWHAPASMLLHIGFTPAGEPRERSPIPQMVNPHILTPETARTTHYFYTRAPGEDSADLAHRVFELEDRPMLEDIDHFLGGRDFWAMKPVILHVDAGAIRARRRLMQLRRGEDRK